MGFVTSVRLPSREVWERARRYARTRGMTVGALVAIALEQYMGREDRIVRELRELRERVESLERALRNASVRLEPERPVVGEVGLERSEALAEEELPSFLRDNPWVEILSRRGDDG